MGKERTNVLLNKDVMILLRNLSRLEGKSVTLLVREAINEFLAKKLPDRDFGIIGIGKSKHSNISKDLKKYETPNEANASQKDAAGEKNK